MTIQISVRLPAGLVQRLDDAVDSGLAPTRSDIVARALEGELRKLAAERDAELLETKRFGTEPGATIEIQPRRAWVE